MQQLKECGYWITFLPQHHQECVDTRLLRHTSYGRNFEPWLKGNLLIRMGTSITQILLA